MFRPEGPCGDLAGNQLIDDEERDPRRDNADRVPSDIPDTHGLQREGDPQEYEDGDDHRPRNQADGWIRSPGCVLDRIARNGETDCGHHHSKGNRAEEEMQPAEPGIETEQETQHWRIL